MLLLFLLFPTTPAAASPFSDHIHPATAPQPTPALVFEDADHTQHALADYRGQYVLLNVWAAWCTPCVEEMPSLEKLQKNFDPKKLRVLPLSEDRSDITVTTFYKAHNITHLPVALDHAGIAPATLHLRGLPTTLLIDPQGLEVARIEGDVDWSSPEVLTYLLAYIGKN